MTVEINVSLIVAFLSMCVTIVSAISFMSKLKYDSCRHDEEIQKQDIAIDNMRRAQTEEMKEMSVRVTSIDKAMEGVVVKIDHLFKDVQYIRSKLP